METEDLMLLGGLAAISYSLMGNKEPTKPTPPPESLLPEGISITSAYPSKAVVKSGERFQIHVNIMNSSGAPQEVTVSFGPAVNIPPQTKTIPPGSNVSFTFDVTATTNTSTSSATFPIYINNHQTTTSVVVTVEPSEPQPPTTNKRDIRVLVKGEAATVFGAKVYTPLPGAEVTLTQGETVITKTTNEDGYTDLFTVKTEGIVHILIKKDGYKDGRYYLDPSTFQGDTALCKVDKTDAPKTVRLYVGVVTDDIFQRPIADARVDVFQNGSSEIKYTNWIGDAGPFIIEEGKGCTIMVTARGYKRYTRVLTPTEADNHQSPFNRYKVKLTKEKVFRKVKHIQVYVDDAERKSPLAYARVTMSQDGEPTQSKETSPSGYTEKFEVVMGKKATFVISKQGYVTQKHTYNLDDWDERYAIYISMVKA